MLAQATAPRGVVHHALCAQEDAAAAMPGPWRQAVSVGAAVAWRGRIRQVCWAVVLVALSLAGLSLPAQAQLLAYLHRTLYEERPRRYLHHREYPVFVCSPGSYSTGL